MQYPEDYIDKVICGDWIEVAKDLPDGCVDLVIMDPPWNVGKNFGGYAKDNLPTEIYWSHVDSWFREIFRVMKDGYLYAFHSDAGSYKLKLILEAIGFEFIQTVIWLKRNGLLSKQKTKGWIYRHVPILFMKKGNAPELLCYSDRPDMWFTSVIDVTAPQSNYKNGRHHPCENPVKLIQKLILRTPGDIILDPFAGVGSLPVAAKNIGRHFISIEINPDYCKKIELRLTAEDLIQGQDSVPQKKLPEPSFFS